MEKKGEEGHHEGRIPLWLILVYIGIPIWAIIYFILYRGVVTP